MCTLNQRGEKKVSALLKSFSVNEIKDAIDTSYIQYYNDDDDSTFELFFKKIGGICAVNRMSPDEKKIAFIKGIVRKRCNYVSEREMTEIINGCCDDGISLDVMLQETQVCRNWTDWRNRMNRIL